MRPVEALRRARPAGLKRSLSFGGGGFVRPPFWSVGDDALWGGTSPVSSKERVEHSFESYVRHAYKANGVVFACMAARMLPFSEARILFQELVDGRAGRLHASGGDLSLLDEPWPNGTTGELLSRMEQDGSLAGNFYATPVVRRGERRLRRLRPDWVTILSGIPADSDVDIDDVFEDPDAFALEAEVIGYLYQPKVPGRTYEPVLLTPERVAHWSPIPDPVAQWRGMSWLTPVLREIDADSAATEHKRRFFENGATPQIVIKYDKSTTPEAFKAAVKAFQDGHQGLKNAYKALHLGGGADAMVVGADLKQLDFKATQGAGESRIAAASGVGAIMAQFSEGMSGSSLNAGNYGSAKRRMADMLLRPNWRTAVASLAKFAEVPAGSRLWYDDDIPFLQEDALDAARIFAERARSLTALTTNGFDADASIRAVEALDFDPLLGKHNGLPSVQQQPTPAPAGD
jgi:phage portal protein BeeE